MAKEVPLTQGKVAIVDDDDYEEVSGKNWRLTDHGYARTVVYGYRSRRDFYMHRIILGAATGEIVDHIDGNRLNNTRSNLRIISAHGNSANSAKNSTSKNKYKGVSYKPKQDKWVAQITCNYKNHYLGLFNTEVEAAEAYNQRAVELFGSFARINHIEQEAIV